MDTVAEVFNRHAKDYDQWFDSVSGKMLFEIEVQTVKLLMTNLIKPCLEIGIGTGRFSQALGIEFGIDPAQKALELAKKRVMHVQQASGEELPFKDNFFGGVFLLFTLCFVENHIRVLTEAKRVLKKGGALIVGIINRESPWGKSYLLKKNQGHPIYKYAHFFSVAELKHIIEQVGMEIKAYSSSLCQLPSENPYHENAFHYLINDAGIICIRAE
jgi:ubiquinone/menaquinone biosynthesis C-methylase UbiE